MLPVSARNLCALQSNIEVVSPTFPSRSLLHRAIWYRIGMPLLLKQQHADLLYCPGGTLAPFAPRSCKTAVAFRNMLPFAPEESARYGLGYMRMRLWLLHQLQAQSFRKADLTIFVSHYAKEVIDKLLPMRAGASEVIPHGVGSQLSLIHI